MGWVWENVKKAVDARQKGHEGLLNWESEELYFLFYWGISIITYLLGIIKAEIQKDSFLSKSLLRFIWG